MHPPEQREPVPLSIHHLPLPISFALFEVRLPCVVSLEPRRPAGAVPTTARPALGTPRDARLLPLPLPPLLLLLLLLLLLPLLPLLPLPPLLLLLTLFPACASCFGAGGGATAG